MLPRLLASSPQPSFKRHSLPPPSGARAPKLLPLVSVPSPCNGLKSCPNQTSIITHESSYTSVQYGPKINRHRCTTVNFESTQRPLYILLVHHHLPFPSLLT